MLSTGSIVEPKYLSDTVGSSLLSPTLQKQTGQRPSRTATAVLNLSPAHGIPEISTSHIAYTEFS